MMPVAETITDIGNSQLPISVIAEAKPLKYTPPESRIEVLQRGRFWGWRWGSKDKRGSKYGGPFADLSEERQREYYRNVERRNKKVVKNA